MIKAIKSLCICICMLNLFSLHGQKLEGRLIDSQTKEPLEYASIGIMGTSQGATTDEEGYFSFDTQGHAVCTAGGLKPNGLSTKN